MSELGFDRGIKAPADGVILAVSVFRIGPPTRYVAKLGVEIAKILVSIRTFASSS
jgi:hypothetical protein